MEGLILKNGKNQLNEIFPPILAGEELRQHLFEEYGPGNTILIPRYLLMKDGVVINEFAPKPSDLSELKEIIGSMGE